MMVGLFLVVVCFNFVRLDAAWSCALDCSWKNIYDQTQSCIFEEKASGERAVCANIFESGAVGERRPPDADSGVNIQHITPYVAFDDNTKKNIVGLNVSFQLPTNVEENEYRGLVIKFTSFKTHCFYINFIQPLKIEDILIMKKFGADVMSLHFDCIRGLLPGETYNVAVIMLSHNSMSEEEAKTITIPLGLEAELYTVSRVTRTMSSSIRTWKPMVQELAFTYPNATLRFSLGPYEYSSYLMILRPVKCIDGECKIASEGPSVEVIATNQTIVTRRYLSSGGIPDVHIPPDKGKVFLEHEDIGLNHVVFVVLELYFVDVGEYRFDLKPLSPVCGFTEECEESHSKPQTNTGNACFYLPCGNATCIPGINYYNRIGEYECNCNETQEGFLYNKSVNACIYDVCHRVQCPGGLCEKDAQSKPMCVCLPEYVRDKEDKCNYEPCDFGWCLKKTMSVAVTVMTLLIVTTSVLLYRMCRGGMSNEEGTPRHQGTEESDDVDSLRRIQDLKVFSESSNIITGMPKCTCSMQSDPPATSNSSGGYMLVSQSEPSSSLSTYCHCIPPWQDATNV